MSSREGHGNTKDLPRCWLGKIHFVPVGGTRAAGGDFEGGNYQHFLRNPIKAYRWMAQERSVGVVWGLFERKK